MTNADDWRAFALIGRQVQHEGAPRARRALDGDLAAVSLDDAFDDAEAEPVAVNLA